MAEPRTPEHFARENERVRVARLRADAALEPAERLEQALRLSRFVDEIAQTGREARGVRP